MKQISEKQSKKEEYEYTQEYELDMAIVPVRKIKDL